ncbi:MAG: hypothetical protein KGJ09_09165 [Candidatus Omnitrophica bacterium]|nr:hypothetical protein [Candidatus Omnitrophota bacterium]
MEEKEKKPVPEWLTPWKPGQSGNPKGRPKTKNLKAKEFVKLFVTDVPKHKSRVLDEAREYGLLVIKARALLEEAIDEGFCHSWLTGGKMNRLVVCTKPEHKFADLEDGEKKDPLTLQEFLGKLRIKSDRAVVPLKFDDWQARDFWRMAPAFVKLATGQDQPGAYKYHWKEYPKGHSKTGDAAIMAAYVLTESLLPISGVCAAGDVDQAKNLKDALRTLQDHNPWLGLTMKVDRVECKATGSSLVFITSDAPTSHGTIPDFVICDEFSHWRDNAQSFWASMFASMYKQKSAVMVVLTNAGFKGSWQFPVRNSHESDPAWCFMVLEGPCASWLNHNELETLKKSMPEPEFRRLFLNEWAEGIGDALRWEDVQAALVLPGPSAGPEPGWDYYAGGDLAKRNDHAAVCLIARNQGTGLIKLAQLVHWAPPIDLGTIKEVIISLDRKFHPDVWFIDPHQAELMVEQMMKQGINCELAWFTGKNNLEMASSMVEVFTSRQILLYPEPALLKDLSRLRIVGGPAGYRLDAPRTSDGHCDRATALALALLAARRSPLGLDGGYFSEDVKDSIWRGGGKEAIGYDRDLEFVPNWG